MKNIITLFLVITCLALTGRAYSAEHDPGHHHDPAPTAGSTQEDIKAHSDCQHCGMDREKFSHSRMLVTYADGTSVGTCSINCVLTEQKAAKGKAVASIEVGDYDTRKLIDAEKAYWVIGGNKRGVMTKTPKWAFATKTAAAAFIKKHGGKPATFKEALVLAEKD